MARFGSSTDTGTRTPTAVRLAAWSAGHPGRAIGSWLVLIALCVVAGMLTGTNRGTFDDFWIGEAGRAEAAATAAGVAPQPVEQILVTSPSGPLDIDVASAAARDVAQGLSELPAVAGVGAPVVAADGTAVRVAVTLKGDVDSVRRSVRAVLERTSELAAEHPGLTIAQTGNASISVGVNDKQGADLARTELISLPITFVVLLLVFGAVLAAGVPVLLALAAFVGSVGLYGVASWVFPDAGGAAISVVFLLGMAVGIDYSLFYLKRVREERARGALTHADAVRIAAATSGRAIATSGLAVIVSLAGLYIVNDAIFSSIATGAILVVVVAVASSLTVLPALLVVLGKRIDGRRRARPGTAWKRILQPALRHPVATLVVGGLVTAVLALPAMTMTLGIEGKETFPKSIPAVGAYDRLTQSFPEAGARHFVVVTADPARSTDVAAALARLTEDPTAVRTSTDRTVSTLLLPVGHPANSAAGRESLDRLRGQLPALLPEPGVTIAVSGDVAAGVDYSAHQAARIPWVIGFVSLATLVVMLFAFGSLVLAAIGVVINLAAVVVSWGVLTAVFQATWAEDLLGFTSTGFIGSRMPLMIFAILVGLSTDYQIFVVSRIREAVQRGVPTRQAVLDGIAGSASVVTSAAVIMISVFLSFMFIDRIEFKQVGLGLTVAVLFDAVVLRALILPAVMTVLGERSWWPGLVRR
ncbi:MMPL family transporter [Pseudonocardia sp. TRM90224]|uniref:MMPL family transporter n=1 Tax=Pseudonocardia sp. TRM90224 TaxID=2812678 RepID=UPI001E3889D4|nr:MMPL family transporter [Pseudonocardia sp. TRM90224]